jgi:flagellar biosynthesis/type III secretory pathway protein FliH
MKSLTPVDVCRVIDTLSAWLRQPEQSELGRSFADWLGAVLLPRRMPCVAVPELENLQEARTLLAEPVKEWTKQWREEGREKGLEKGLEKGRQEGRKEGEAQFLIRLLERKFGLLDDEIRQRIDAADRDQLLEWGERILKAERIEEVFC